MKGEGGGGVRIVVHAVVVGPLTSLPFKAGTEHTPSFHLTRLSHHITSHHQTRNGSRCSASRMEDALHPAKRGRAVFFVRKLALRTAGHAARELAPAIGMVLWPSCTSGVHRIHRNKEPLDGTNSAFLSSVWLVSDVLATQVASSAIIVDEETRYSTSAPIGGFRM